jgi:hypothetical protein
MKDLKHGETSFQVNPQPDLFAEPQRKPTAPSVDLDRVRTMPTFRRVMRYSMSIAELEPIDVYRHLGHDKATWSKIESGAMSFQADKILPFCEVTRNIAVIDWLAFKTRHELHPLRSELEQKLEAAEARAIAAENELEVVKRFFRDTKRPR